MGAFYNNLIILFVALGSVTFGFSNSVIGSVLGLPGFFLYFNLHTTGAGAAKANQIVGATSGLFAGGAAIGALILTWLADRVGRVRAVQITCGICIIAGIIQGASVHIAMFLIGRFIAGVGVGLIVTLVPVYQSEIAPPAIRGRMVASHGIFLVSGYALSAWVGYGCYFATNLDFQWRFCLSAQCIAPLLLLMGTPWLPESPRWLIERDQLEKAFTNLSRLHSEPGANDDLKAREEFHQMRAQIETDKVHAITTGRWGIFTIASNRRRLICGCGVMFLAQSSGVLVVNNYQVSLYKGLGLSGSVPLLLYALYLTWAAFMNWVSSIIIDRVGRVRLILLGLVLGSASIACESAMLATYGGTANKVGNGFGVFFLFMFVGIYAVTIDATAYVYAAEVFPTHIRAKGMGLSVFVQSCTTLVYTQAAPTAFAAIGWKYYLVFIIIPLLGTLIVFRFFPETKGLSLEEIAAQFGDEVVAGLTYLDAQEKETLDEKLRTDHDKIFEHHGEKNVASKV